MSKHQPVRPTTTSLSGSGFTSLVPPKASISFSWSRVSFAWLSDIPRGSFRTYQPIVGCLIVAWMCDGPRGGRARALLRSNEPNERTDTVVLRPTAATTEMLDTRLPVFGSFSTHRYALPPTNARCVPSVARTSTRETPSAAMPNEKAVLG